MTRKEPRFEISAELPAMRRYGQVLTRDPAEAEDLVQQALLRAYEKRSQFRLGSALRPWLLSILHNCFVDGIRRKRSEQTTLAIASRMSPGQQAPEQEHHVRLAQIRKGFMALPEEQRAALHLVAMEGLTYQEAAATLGIPVGTLMSRLARARAALRALEDGSAAQLPSLPQRTPQLRIVGGKDDPSE
jgi:RNA polymerase sigma-70 factor (ECF subfamily)